MIVIEVFLLIETHRKASLQSLCSRKVSEIFYILCNINRWHKHTATRAVQCFESKNLAAFHYTCEMRNSSTINFGKILSYIAFVGRATCPIFYLKMIGLLSKGCLNAVSHFKKKVSTWTYMKFTGLNSRYCVKILIHAFIQVGDVSKEIMIDGTITKCFRRIFSVGIIACTISHIRLILIMSSNLICIRHYE